LIFIDGRTTFTQGAKFDSLTVGSIENTTFEASKLLLRTGNQEFTDTPTFSAVHFHDLKAERINNVDLTIIDKSYNYKDNRLGFVEPLTVSHLEVTGNVEANIGILDGKGNVIKHIDLHEIDDYALRKNGTRQLIKLPHHYAKLVANRVIDNNQTINKKQWPEEFVGIRSEQSHPNLNHSTNIYLGDAEFSMLTVESKIVDNQDKAEILVDTGALDIALLNSPNTFTGHKTIKNISLQKNSEVTSQTVFGMNMTTLNSYVSNAEIPFTAPLTLSSDQFQLNGTVSLGELSLGPNGAIYTINEINQPVLSNLSTLYSDGIRRNVSALPDLVSSMSNAVFENDFSVKTLNGLSPKNDYLQLSGASPRSLSNVRFMNEVKFTKDIAQFDNSTVKTCRAHISKAPFCKIEANGDCCRKNSAELCQCEIKKGECVVKSDVHNLEVCNEIVLHELTYVHKGSLKVTGDTTLAKNVEFLGGFSAKKLSVKTEDCSLNGIKCDRIASRIHPEIFTAGINKFGNTIASLDDIAISQTLIVGTKINTVDVDHMFSDTLLINGSAASLPQALTLQNRAEVDKFTSNGVNIGDTPVDDLLNRNNHVVNQANSNPTTICGKLRFKKSLDTKLVKSSEIDSVDTANFFSNFWTKKEQNITGDITVKNADFKDKLLANKKDSSLSTINMVDLVNLNNDAVRIDDSQITLKDVHFNVAHMLHGSGLSVKNQFLGLDTSKIVAKENADTVVVNGDKTFKNPVLVDGNVELSESTWKNAGGNSIVNIDKFIEFQDNSSFSKVEFKKNLKLTHELTASTVNRESLTSLRDTKVFANANNTLAFDIAFSQVKAQDKIVTNPGFKINNKDLDYWKANYVSLSKNNTITGQHKFSAGLKVEGILQATHIHHKNAKNKEQLIQTDGLSINLAELNRRALFKDEPHTNILNTLKIPTATVNGDVITDLVNNVDLAETALDYVSSKTMVNVSLDGNLEAAAVNTNVMEFPVKGTNDQSYLGVEVSADVMTVTISSAESNAVLKSSDDVAFSGKKTFSGTATVANLTANRMQDFEVGTCTTPTILLTDSCNNQAQVIKGDVSFGANVDVTNLVIKTMTVNNKSLTTLGDKAVLKSETGEIVFTGRKTIQQLDISGSSNVTLNDKVFDLQVDKIVESALQSVTLPNQPTNLSSVVRQISSESYEVPSTFVYSAIQVPSEGDYKLHPLAPGPNPTSFRVLGFSAADGVRVYNLPTDMTQTSSELTHAFEQRSYKIATDEVRSYTQTNGDVVVAANFRSKHRGKNVMCLGTFFVSDSKARQLKCIAKRSSDPKNVPDPLKPYAFTTVQLGAFPGIAMVEKNWGGNDKSSLALKLEDGVTDWLALENKIWFNDTGINLRIESSRTPEDIGFTSAPTILAVGSRDKGELHIIKGTSRQDLAYVQKMRVQFGTLFKLISWNDETYIAMIAPERDDNRLVIAKFESNQFKLFQMLVVEKPMDLSWYIHNGHLFVRVLFGDHIKSRVKSFKLKGTMFEESPDSQIQLSGVESYTEFCRSCNTPEAQMIVTTGSATTSRLNQFRGVPVNSVHRFMYKDNEVAKYRQEYKNKDPAIPKFYTMDCHNMVGWYAKKLHETNDLPVGGFTYQDAGSMLLQLMPRRYVHYRTMDCDDEIKNFLDDPKFKDLLDKPLPNGVANLYPYTNNGRDLNNFLGFVHIYQEADGVFYTFTGLSLNNSFVSKDAVHAISFHASCELNDGTTYNAESFHYNSTNSSPNKPFAKNSGDHLQQCAVYHDVDAGLSNRLKSLDNKSVAGAVVIHKRDSSKPFEKPVDSAASRLGCGYIKHPEQAKFQYTQDHGDTFAF